MRCLAPALFLIPFLALRPSLSAREAAISDEKLLEQAIKSAGGYGKFQRLETVAYDFEETGLTGGTPVKVRGRDSFKLHDQEGLRGRRFISTASGGFRQALLPAARRNRNWTLTFKATVSIYGLSIFAC